MVDIGSLICWGGLIVVIGVPILSMFIRTIYDYQKGLVLTLGKYTGLRGSGLQFIVPGFQDMNVVDMRIQAMDIPKQEVLSKDNVSAFINAVVYFRITDPEAAVFKVQDYRAAVFQHAQTAIRDVVGSRTLDQLLTDRKAIADSISVAVDKDAHEWGLDISGIKIQDIGLPDSMKQAMARQAQAEREKRASIIMSEGESLAADKLAAAAKVLSESPGALHLRTLQMISSVSADKTNILNFLLPIEGVQFPDKMDAAEKKKAPKV
jgi:regulator of protease activity HflC (stomatin/prohibitin superfamily)